MNDRSIGIYVHIPYCVKKCPYCDFNSYAIDEQEKKTFESKEAEYRDALLAEIRFRAAESTWSGRPSATVFFGGGTPSLFSASSIETILKAIDRCFPLTPGAEVTLEANPGTIGERLGREKLADFRRAGVNRISMGVQSFQAEKLRFLGRIHRPEDSLRAVENIRSAGFENMNLDLMFGVEGEQSTGWRLDLEQAASLSPEHISAYNLTIEPGTEFHRQRRKGVQLLTEEANQAEFYLLCLEILESRGYRRYEISNFAKPEKECQHNLGYWSGREYIGLGAGAHSYALEAPTETGSQALRWSNIPKPEHYIERAGKNGDASQRLDRVNREKDELEVLYTRLRLTSGLPLEEYEQRFGVSFQSRYADALSELGRDALIEVSSEHARLTSRGFLFADHVLERLAAAT